MTGWPGTDAGAVLGIETLAPVAADADDGPIAPYPADRLRIDGAEAISCRQEVQHASDQQAEHFAQGAGVDIGVSYAGGAFVPDGSPPPSRKLCDYRPDAHPGARPPRVGHGQSPSAAGFSG